MAPIKCCVSGCSATNLTHRLYSFPKDDNLQALWLSFLVPFNSDLLGLSKDQLLNKRVCQKHFDRSQLDGEGKRLKGGYPCLFSAKEMEHGVPLSYSSQANDHNYSIVEIDEQNLEIPLLLNTSVQEHSYSMVPETPTTSSLPYSETTCVSSSSSQLRESSEVECEFKTDRVPRKVIRRC
ncbi:hypothetical protein ACJJTC_016064 [Scirpophaga incertulas]